jgi:nucleoside phosphorylase
MKLLLCSATPNELKVVKEEIKKLDLKTRLPIVYLCTGIGNHETIFQLTKFLMEHQDETFFIVNIGVCGYTGALPPKAIQASIVAHIDTRKESIIPIFLQIAPLGKVVSSEIVIDDKKVLKLQANEEIFVDMESRGIELVAQHFLFPRLMVKVPVDNIGEETKYFNREKALEMLKNQIDYRDLIMKLLGYI